MWEKYKYTNGILVGPRGGAGYNHKDGRLRIFYKGKAYYTHRVIWEIHHGKTPDGLVIDHINGDCTDNRIENLRAVTHQGNAQNERKARKTSKTGILGVTFRHGKWLATIVANKKRMHLGYFSTPIEASNAYLAAKRTFHETCSI